MIRSITGLRPTESTETVRVLLRQTILFAVFTLLLIALNSDVLKALVAFARGNATASHVLLVPFVTLVLLYQERKVIFSAVRPAVAVGPVIVASGAAVLLAGRLLNGVLTSQSLLSVSVAGAIVSWIGGFVFFFGLPAFRAALFPLLFLGFTVPIPAPVVDQATFWLKRGSTETVAALFSVTGTPYLREGFVFSLPNVVIEVADACSGIRSSIGLLLTSLLAGHTFLNSAWARAVVVLAIFPLAVLKNGIRIAALTLLSIHVDPAFLTGQLHHEGGFLFFLLALALLAPVVLFLRRYEAAYPAGA